MIVRSVSALAVLAALSATPAFAQGGVTPGAVLAAKVKHGNGDRDFLDRTARMSSIIGPELSRAAPLRVPTKPVWHRTVRHDADAAPALR